MKSNLSKSFPRYPDQKVYEIKNFRRKVEVSFKDCDLGWIHFDVRLGRQTVTLRASDIYDPFPDLISWLEAIAVGVQCCAFQFDEEGDDKKLELSKISWDRYDLTISQPYDPPYILLSGSVNPVQLVDEFYGKLKLFGQSPDYRKDQWETETLGERMAQFADGTGPGFDLKEGLLTLDRQELMEVFFKAAPRYWINFPGAKEKGEEWSRCLDYVLYPDNPEKHTGVVETPIEWGIPDDYDTLPLQRKAVIVQECLDEKVGSHDGTKLGQIHSAIVEDWLQRRK